MLSGLKPPEHLDLSQLDINFLRNWLEAFEDYYDLSTSKPDDAHKCKSLLSIAGLQVRSLVKGFEPQPSTYNEMKDMIMHHVQPFKSISIERHKFLTCFQLSNETINEYVSRLKNLVTTCSFNDDTIDTIPNQLIRDQLIIGIRNKKITEALLQQGDISLIEVIKKANAIEQTEKNISALKETDHTTFQIDMVSPINASEQTRRRVICDYCKKSGHNVDKCFKLVVCEHCKKYGHNVDECFKRATCSTCGRTGHTAKFCKSRNSKGVLSVHCDKNENKLRFLECVVLGKNIKFLVDTGASISIISTTIANKFGWTCLLDDKPFRATVADGHHLELSRSFQTALTFFDTTISARLFVGEISVDAILGVDLLDRLKFSMSICGHSIFSVLPDFQTEFSDLFDRSLGDSCLTGVEIHEIIPTPNEKPMRTAVRPVNRSDNQFIKEKLNELSAAGVIEVSHSPWRSCPVVVAKADGGKRLTINYKPVNSQTIFDAYPVPNIEQLILKLNDAKIFSKIDFSQFYHQIPLSESDRPKTAFHADGQLWQYTRLPFGLKNGVAACSRIMNTIFGDIPNCLLYLDDLLIYGPTADAHDETLKEVLNLVRKHGLGLNSKKCSFRLTSVEFLGFFVENGTIKPCKSRTETLENFPLPGDLKSLERFLGFVTYFSKYVKHFSDVCKPLLDIKNSLLSNRKQNPVIDFWPPAALESFETIKKEISNSVLVLPGSDDELVLRTDASDKAIAAILQTSTGEPVSFFSRVLSSSEKNYDIVEKEALAVYWGITRSRMILLNRKFTVITDHKPIQFLFNSIKVSPKILRWRLALQEYNFDVLYCPGKQNVVADCFSRINSIDFAPPTVELSSVERSQELDSECQSVIAAIVSNQFKQKPTDVSYALWSQRKSLKVKQGVLYNHKEQIFVPKLMRLKILTLCHGLHRGITSTLSSLRETCFWPGHRKAVEEFVKNCRICSFTKPAFLSPPDEPLVTKAPMEIIALDYIGPLPISQGYKYILTAIDLFSRYAFAFPVRDLSSDTLILTCKELFCITGFPDSILTDRGTQFLSEAFLDFMKKYCIHKISTNAYSPKSNGCSERFNGTLQCNIKAYLNQVGLSRYHWQKAIPSALLNYRTSVHTSINCRPVDLFFGFSVKGLEVSKKETDRSQKLRDQAIANMHRNSFLQNTDSRFCRLNAGQEVLVKFPSSPKFALKGRLGKVERMINQTTVRVIFPDNTFVQTALHRISLVPTDAGLLSHDPGAYYDTSTSEFQPPINLSQNTQPDNPQPQGQEQASGDPIDFGDTMQLPRRSQRPHRPPFRLGIDDQPTLT